MSDQSKRLAAVVNPIFAKLLDRVDLDDRQHRAVNAAVSEAAIAGFVMGSGEAFGEVNEKLATVREELAPRGIDLNISFDPLTTSTRPIHGRGRTSDASLPRLRPVTRRTSV